MTQMHLHNDKFAFQARGWARVGGVLLALLLLTAVWPGALAEGEKDLNAMLQDVPELYSQWQQKLTEPWALKTGTAYTLRLTFAEGSGRSFTRTDSEMVYRLPENLSPVSDGEAHVFSVWAGSALARAAYRVDEAARAVYVRWDETGMNYGRLLTASNRQFTMDIPVVYLGGGSVDFGQGRVVEAVPATAQEMRLGGGHTSENGFVSEGEYNGRTVRDFIPREVRISVFGESPKGAEVREELGVPGARIAPESFYAERVTHDASGQEVRETLSLAGCGIKPLYVEDDFFLFSLPAMGDQEELVIHYYAVMDGGASEGWDYASPAAYGASAFLLRDAWGKSSTLLRDRLQNAYAYARFDAEEGADSPVFTVRKIDENGLPLGGAAYRLEEKLPDGSLRLVEQNEKRSDGVSFVYENLSAGDYLLTETAAPDGYVLAAPQEFTVTDGRSVRWRGTPEAFRYAMYTLTGIKPEGEVLWITHKDVSMLEEPGVVAPTVLRVKTRDVNDSDPAQDTAAWTDYADYDLGDAVPFRLEAKLASNVSSFRQYRVTFADTMEAGLTNLGDYSVTVVRGGEEIPVDGADYQVLSEDGHSFRLRVEWGDGEALLPHDLNGALVRVYFSARLNEDLAVGEQGNANAARAEYTAHAGQETEQAASTGEAKAVVFSYQLRFTKEDQDGNPLPGAVFTLEKVIAARQEGEEDTLAEVPADAASGGAEFVFTGLDDGEYILTETLAPEGCFPAEPARLTVSAEHETDAHKDGASPLRSLRAEAEGVNLAVTGADQQRGVIAAAFLNERKLAAIARVGDWNDSDGAGLTWQDTADHDIGDSVPFRVTARLPSNISSYYRYRFVFTDTLAPGFTASGDCAVTVGGEPFPGFTVQETENGFEAVLVWDGGGEPLPEALAGKEIALTFSAVLNDKAALGEAGNLHAVTLRYPAGPGDDAETESPASRNLVYTYGLVVNKTDETGALLPGASFRLEKLLADGTRAQVALNAARSTPSSFAFVGLDDGDYVLTETHTPTGYTALDPVFFTVNAVHASVWDGSGETQADALAELSAAAPEGGLSLAGSKENGLLTGALANAAAPTLGYKVADRNDSLISRGTVLWVDSADYDVGDAVPLRIRATLVSGMSRFTEYRLTFTNVLESGLSNNRDYQVYVNGAPVDGFTLEDSDRGFDLTLAFGDGEAFLPEELNGAEVLIQYTATLTSDARAGAQGNLSTVRLRYGFGGHEHLTGERSVLVFTYQLLVTCTNVQGQQLPGAEYTLHKRLEDGSLVTVAPDASSTDTQAVFFGLDDGDYILTQTQAPEGYLSAGMLPFSIQADHTSLWNGGRSTRGSVLTSLSGGDSAGNAEITASRGSGAVAVNILNTLSPFFEKKVDDLNDSTNAEDAVEWGDSADCDIGDSVRFLLRAKLPANFSSFQRFRLTFTDTMEEGFTNGRDYRVTVNGLETDAFTVKRETDRGFEITLSWEGAQIRESLNGAEVQVLYTACLNEKAWVGGEGNVNSAVMRYTSSLDGKTEAETEKQRAIVFTYRFTVTKADESGRPLRGAAFKLEKVLANGDKKQIPLNEGTSTDTAFSFRGLDDGRYILTETKSPAGYLLAPPVEFTITADHDTEWDNNLYVRAMLLNEVTAETDSIDVTIRADSETMNLRTTIIDERSSEPIDGRNIVYRSRFSFTKQWLGGVEDSIDFTLYRPNGTVRHKGFNKTQVSDTEFLYEAWFANESDYYVVEEPVKGYKTRYENVGAHARETDRCYNGGTIINYRVPKTGDEAQIGLWIGLAAASLGGLAGLCLIVRRRRARK